MTAQWEFSVPGPDLISLTFRVMLQMFLRPTLSFWQRWYCGFPIRSRRLQTQTPASRLPSLIILGSTFCLRWERDTPAGFKQKIPLMLPYLGEMRNIIESISDSHLIFLPLERRRTTGFVFFPVEQVAKHKAYVENKIALAPCNSVFAARELLIQNLWDGTM